MKSRIFSSVFVAVILTAGMGALGQNWTSDRSPDEFSGVINAYTPQSTTGPYEVRGPWSLLLHEGTRKADFSAALNMELSDGWVITKNNDNFDPDMRDHHTHHITMTGAEITALSTGGFQVSGMATVTLNGNPAPISPTPLTLEITGGSDVEFSNITLTFGSPGSKHFGTMALTGVVRHVDTR